MRKGNLLLFNKPYGILSQFTGDAPNLSHFIPLKGYYPAGRLDKDSEGLLLLTNEGELQARIADPKFKMEKTYLAQLEGDVSEAAIQQLSHGVKLKDGMTRPATVQTIACPLPPRDPPVRFRQTVPTSWIELTITEGRNRQVRRMTAAVGYPTLRLYRRSVGPWSLDGISAGEYRVEQVNLPRRR